MPRPPNGMGPESSSPWTRMADRQWRQARPKMVKALEAKGHYRRALRMAADVAAERMGALWKQGADPLTAKSDALEENLYLPDETEVPVLPADLVPLAHLGSTTGSPTRTNLEEEET